MEFADKVIATNYYGTKNIIKAMIPLMRPSEAGARIVNVSSRLGRLNGRKNVSESFTFTLFSLKLVNTQPLSSLILQRIENLDLRKKLEDEESLSEELIDQTMGKFLEQVKDGTWTEGGWPQAFTDYSLSKLAVNAYTRVMARIFAERPEGEKIYINCYCPGWVKTAMTGWAGHVSPEDGADTAVWLALLPDQFVSGKFFSERREIHF